MQPHSHERPRLPQSSRRFQTVPAGLEPQSKQKQTTFSCLGHGDERPPRTERSARRQLGAPPTGDSGGRIPSFPVWGSLGSGRPETWGQQAVRTEANGDGILPGLGPRGGRVDALTAEQEIEMNSRSGGVGIIGVIVIVVVILIIVGVIKL